MQPCHMRATIALSPEAIALLEQKFQLPRQGSLYFRLRDANVDQAQAVVILINHNLWDDVTLLVGRPVPVVCPPCLTRMNEPIVKLTPGEDDLLKVVWVGPNTKQAWRSRPGGSSDAHSRFALIKVGMSVRQLMMRGVTRRDIREWKAEGLLKIEQQEQRA